jgi:membrane protease YdiL (CAAX protease family)
MRLKQHFQSTGWLVAELAAIFIIVPCFFYFHATRWNIHAALFVIAVYGLITLDHCYGYDVKKLWHGIGWSERGKKIAVLRFLISTPLIIGLTYILVPERLFSFPVQRTILWLVVMILYPILSVIPQEVVFRSFFFERYKTLLPKPWVMITVSSLTFALAHVVFHNWVSPLLCLIGGLMFSHSYNAHRSLKWVILEHAAYGCMVFTAGIGVYFLVNGFRIS